MNDIHGSSYADPDDGINLAASESESEATPLVLLQVTSCLGREMPIRFAHRIRDLADVPLLRDVASVATVRDLYTKSLLKVLSVAQ